MNELDDRVDCHDYEFEKANEFEANVNDSHLTHSSVSMAMKLDDDNDDNYERI